MAKGNEVPQEVKVLAQKPYRMVRKYSNYSLNGCTFHTKSFGEGKATQCDGVALIGKTSSFSSTRDDNPSTGDVAYYGHITEIIELNYMNIGYVVLFKCDWVDSVQGRGFQKEKYGITQVNFNVLLNNGSSAFDEPYILAIQASQVYFVQDPIDRLACCG
uniref:DUF4216 domain-containing protein n=1 Tax=Arundo donax TaxID=35708 RepID=A0A0A9BYZ8_ARUDO